MLLLNNDCICKIYKSYINNFIKCRKNYIELKKFMFCRKFELHFEFFEKAILLLLT